MDLYKRLAEWQERGLLDPEARARIEAYEQGRKQHPIWLYTMGGLGALTIAVGLVSVVAANWDGMGRTTKLGGDLLLGAGLAYALFVAWQRGKSFQTDLLAGVYYGYVLASIALIGQVYQLGTPTYQGLLVWSVCTLPLLLFVRGGYVAAVWLAGTCITIGAGEDALLDALNRQLMHDSFSQHEQRFVENLSLQLTLGAFIVLMVVARLPWFRRERPRLSATWSGLLWSAAIAGAFAAPFLLYGADQDSSFDASQLVGGLVVLAACVLLPRLYPELSRSAQLGQRLLLVFTWLMITLPRCVVHDDAQALGAIAQIAALAIACFMVLQAGNVAAFNLLSALIGLRVLAMYFEVFGSMMDTGLGLLTGGILTVLLAWFWKRNAPSFAARLGGGSSHAS
jgi:uncharacterized membrane protein